MITKKSKMDHEEILYTFFCTINKSKERTAAQGTNSIRRERTLCTDTHSEIPINWQM